MTTRVGQLIDELMDNMGIDDTKLSSITKVAKANISRLRRDPNANPTLATLKPLAEFFGITVSQLLGEAPLDIKLSKNQEYSRRLPLIQWDTEMRSPLEKKTNLEQSFLPTEKAVSEEAFALSIEDSTFSPLFPLGAIILIDKLNEYHDGMYVLVSKTNHDKPILKQYVIDGPLTFLKSVKMDSNWVDPFTDDYQILGAVIEVRYRMSNHA